MRGRLLLIAILIATPATAAGPLVIGGTGPHWWAVKLPPGLESLAFEEKQRVSAERVGMILIYDSSGSIIEAITFLSAFTRLEFSASFQARRFGGPVDGPLLGSSGWSSGVECDASCSLPENGTLVVITGGSDEAWTTTVTSQGAPLGDITHGPATYYDSDTFPSTAGATVTLGLASAATTVAGAFETTLTDAAVGTFFSAGAGHAELARQTGEEVEVCPCADYDLSGGWMGAQRFTAQHASVNWGTYLLLADARPPP